MDRTRTTPEPQVGRIVVGIDASDHSRAALAWAVRHATAVGATVVATAAWHEPVQTSPIGARSHETFREQARSRIHDAINAVGAVDVVPDVQEGRAGEVLLDRAAEADLLVLGHTGGRVAPAGQVAQQCLRQAPCPVVLVPVPDGRTARRRANGEIRATPSIRRAGDGEGARTGA
jgi:nucleotide-binding universal stress UspA family protein